VFYNGALEVNLIRPLYVYQILRRGLLPSILSVGFAFSLRLPFGGLTAQSFYSGVIISALVAVDGWAETNLRLRLAKEWEKTGDIPRALQELRLYLTEFPEDPDAYAWMADLHQVRGDDSKALEAFALGLKKVPDSKKLLKGQEQLKARIEGKSSASVDGKSAVVKTPPENLPPQKSAPSPTTATPLAQKETPQSKNASQGQPEKQKSSPSKPGSEIKPSSVKPLKESSAQYQDPLF
jgi:hypothetical protein